MALFRTRNPHFANTHENEPTTSRRSLNGGAEWLPGDRPESTLTSDNSENITYGRQSCQLRPGQGASGVRWAHDYAYVHPAVVGRLTAAVLTYVPNGRRSRRPFLCLPPGEPAGGCGGFDQEVER